MRHTPVGAKQIRGSEKPHQKEKESIGKERIVCYRTSFLCCTLPLEARLIFSRPGIFLLIPLFHAKFRAFEMLRHIATFRSAGLSQTSI